MKTMRRSISIIMLLMMLALAAGHALAETEARPDGSIYRDLLLSVDYGDQVTYVIGHKSPDSDTVGSAMAYAYLLDSIGISAEAVVSAPVNSETRYALETFGLEAPPVMDDAAGKQFVLVDHSRYTQAIDGMEDARIVGIVDHHGIGDVAVDAQISVRCAHVGATASLVYMAYRECEVDIPTDMARVMLMSLLSDTRNMTMNISAADRAAYEGLVQAAQIEDPDALYRGMEEASISYAGMDDWEIFRSDYKEYDVEGATFAVACVNAVGTDAMKDMSDRMLAQMEEHYGEIGLDMLFVLIENKSEDEGEPRTCMAAFPEEAEMILEKVYGGKDASGYYLFEEAFMRKRDLIPALMDALA
ncbi:MAG: hypothetical protein E7317_02115 [Clostridiales bacterium]|nr:hypothetical protein [Clostridiales bacterium]